MSCGCGNWNCNGGCGCARVYTNCSSVCGSLVVTNSWNIPACGMTAVLSVPRLKVLQLNSYLWNPDYGYFQITSFNSNTGEVVVTNTCVDGNEAPGTIIPASTQFIVTDTPFEAKFTFDNVNSFLMPACGSTVVVETNGVPDIEVGTYVWNPTAGFLEVTVYNTTTLDLTLKNNCNAGNATVGTNIVAGSSFFLTPPPGASDDTNWTPSVSGGGGMTVSALVITQATYWEVGNMVFFILCFSCTLGGVADTQLIATLGTTAIGNASVSYDGAISSGGAYSTLGRWQIISGSPGTLIAYKGIATNWDLGAAQVTVQGFYQKA